MKRVLTEEVSTPASKGTLLHNQKHSSMNIINYNYKGSQISFEKGNNVMVNATQMAKPFGKRPIDWYNLPSTNAFLKELEAVRKSNRSDIIKTINGIGTWYHEDVALEFARWLSPKFAIWCNDRIKELLRTGVATVSDDDQAIAYAMQVLNKRLEQARIDKELLEQQNVLLTNEIKVSAPKLEYVDNVLNATNTYTSTQVAKELELSSADKLHQILKDKKIMFNQSGQWMLTAKYAGKRYTKPRTATFFNQKTQQNETNTITVWTEKGRSFLHSILTA